MYYIHCHFGTFSFRKFLAHESHNLFWTCSSGGSMWRWGDQHQRSHGQSRPSLLENFRQRELMLLLFDVNCLQLLINYYVIPKFPPISETHYCDSTLTWHCHGIKNYQMLNLFKL